MHHAPSHAPLRHLGVREAARELGLAHTTVGRYLRAYPELNHGSEGRPRVDLSELRRHRAANLNPAPRGRKAAKVLAVGDPAPVAVAEAPPAATRTESPPNYAHAKAVCETVLAQRARVDLDEKRGLLVPRAEVEDAVYDAGTVLQRDFLELGPQLAERIAVMSDPRAIAELLLTKHRRVLAALAASLRAKAAAEEENHASAEVIPLHESRP